MSKIIILLNNTAQKKDSFFFLVLCVKKQKRFVRFHSKDYERNPKFVARNAGTGKTAGTLNLRLDRSTSFLPSSSRRPLLSIG